MDADLLIVFDLGDFSRTGEIGQIAQKTAIDIVNLDHHHIRDDSMYTLSIVDTKSPSTTYMIWKYFQHLNKTNAPFSDNIAVALYAGLVNDTGSFRYEGVTSETHIMAAQLLLSNINPNKVYQHVYENKSFIQPLIFGAGDGNLQYYLYNWKCPEMKSNDVGLVLL